MEIFYIVTLSVAVVLLILILTYLGLKMASEDNQVGVYPPNKMRCPDTWKNVKDNEEDELYKCAVPDNGELNIGSMYTSEEGTTLQDSVTSAPGFFEATEDLPARFDFTVSGWAGYKSGLTADCSKRTWSSEQGIMWDGITNYSSCD